jgi:hypothetical protein
VQETRISGRLAYHKVLGTKNPADVLTKHVPGELLERHLETLGAEMRGGRSELAPELMSLAISWVQWYRPLEAEEETTKTAPTTAATTKTAPTTAATTWTEQNGKKVTFAKLVKYRAVEHANKGRSCSDKSVGRINQSWRTTESDKVEKQRWCDMVDSMEEATLEQTAVRTVTSEEKLGGGKVHEGEDFKAPLSRRANFLSARKSNEESLDVPNWSMERDLQSVETKVKCCSRSRMLDWRDLQSVETKIQTEVPNYYMPCSCMAETRSRGRLELRLSGTRCRR